ncbi:S8 family serine peptidase [bacterium]|nr:S8 family serine peptidase [bacterium]
MKSLRCLTCMLMSVITLTGLSVFSGSGYAAAPERDRTVYAFVLNDAVTHDYPPGTASVKSSSIETLCTTYDVEAVIGAFPDFDEADTLRNNGEVDYPCLNLYKIFAFVLEDENDMKNFMADLEDDTDISFVQYDIYPQPLSDPDDDYFDDQWNLEDRFVSLDMSSAWDYTTGDDDIVIGILDFGMDPSENSDLDGDWFGAPGVSSPNSGDWYPIGSNIAHAFAIAGIAAAETNNNYGIAGCDYDGLYASRPFILHNQINRLDDVELMVECEETKILNLGWEWSDDDYIDMLSSDLLKRAYMEDRLIVCAAGNAPSAQTYPGKLSFSLTVGGYDSTGDHYGRESSFIDVVAPAVDVWTTQDDEGFEQVTGTSFAAAHVSGIASLIWNYDTSLKNDDVANIIKLSAVPMGEGEEWGTGRVNGNRALEFLDDVTYFNNDITFDYSQNGGWVHEHDGARIAMQFMTNQGFITRWAEVDTVYMQRTLQSLCSRTFTEPPYVWGRGSESTGMSGEDPNFAAGFTEVTFVNQNVVIVRAYRIHLFYYFEGGSAFFTTPWPGYAITVAEKNTPFAIDNLTLSDGEDSHPLLEWRVHEVDVDSFLVYRYRDPEPLTGHPAWYHIATVEENSFTDTTFAMDDQGGAEVRYKLKVRDLSDNLSAYSNQVDTVGYIELPKRPVSSPEEFRLLGVYPNPANPSTTFEMELPIASDVTIHLFDIQGRMVTTLTSRVNHPGLHQIVWNGRSGEDHPLASGVYFYRITAGTEVGSSSNLSGKIVLMK